ncbi:hypothetical protein PLICRDRAFT_180300 [Plicaturopsis crispa FD-325 SS-3]|uniref:Uncharacterized protein n=1 Tax=Plicaturopsis crispa FD-325 SS-3 TaxID=944288 RepID=A0A0C9SQA4_PLICR|nr:hypothetical protein PLICRDRAFT_180300 [Plicaturopsis crispa FD-325 SS-3]
MSQNSAIATTGLYGGCTRTVDYSSHVVSHCQRAVSPVRYGQRLTGAHPLRAPIPARVFVVRRALGLHAAYTPPPYGFRWSRRHGLVWVPGVLNECRMRGGSQQSIRGGFWEGPDAVSFD